jgi:hypothetical protein
MTPHPPKQVLENGRYVFKGSQGEPVDQGVVPYDTRPSKSQEYETIRKLLDAGEYPSAVMALELRMHADLNKFPASGLVIPNGRLRNRHSLHFHCAPNEAKLCCPSCLSLAIGFQNAAVLFVDLVCSESQDNSSFGRCPNPKDHIESGSRASGVRTLAFGSRRRSR